MEWIKHVVDIFLHLDEHLSSFISQYGTWTYAVLIATIFCETGLVVLPLLPGDSLLFAAGSMAALGALDPHVLFVTLSIAAIIGDSVNYAIGRRIGVRVFSLENSRIFKKSYMERTHRFYEKYGGKTIILARFVPIVRTFAPFVAGVGAMTYRKFLLYNVVGGIVWVAMFVYAGYFFGNIPFVKKNFEFVILGIIFVSILPPIVEVLRARLEAKRGVAEAE
ncbi:MAG: DedA family protein [Verrucomicrobia bacterium]|nr:DedA family protein [Verrucomicrobiota bacterium]